MEIHKVLLWSEKISDVAAQLLRRDTADEKRELRKLIDEWCDEIEPIYNSVMCPECKHHQTSGEKNIPHNGTYRTCAQCGTEWKSVRHPPLLRAVEYPSCQ